jgi:hypothetical protein
MRSGLPILFVREYGSSGPSVRTDVLSGDRFVFQTIERSLDGEDVLTVVGEQRRTPG